MLENEPVGDEKDVAATENTTDESTTDTPTSSPPRRPRRAATRPAGPPSEEAQAAATPGEAATGKEGADEETVKKESTRKRTRAKRPGKKPEKPAESPPEEAPSAESPAGEAAESPAGEDVRGRAGGNEVPLVTFQPPAVVFQPPQVQTTRPGGPVENGGEEATAEAAAESGADGDTPDDGPEDAEEGSGRRRRRRGGRGRGKSKESSAEEEPSEKTGSAKTGSESADEPERPQGASDAPDASEPREPEDERQESSSTRRRRRRRRGGSGEGAEEPRPDDPPKTVVKVREPRPDRGEDEQPEGVKGSTRLEAKKQRRREGREQRRRRPPVITESEFLARRESVERVMVVRQAGDRIQIAVLEDGVLVEHYVNRQTQQSYVGNVYLGRVQNVLPSMEAAFVDIGKGRNAVLYAGEVNYDATGLEGQPKRIEQALKSGQSVLVQVTKDPIGHKGARLTSQMSLPGRYLVYVPEGSMTGISRKLPEGERARLKQVLKKIMPDGAGVIVRTAAEGASEEELSRDVTRLSAQWEDIQRKAKSSSAPALLYGEPDLAIRVVRDIFNEDFTQLVVSGDDVWEMVEPYVSHVAPHLRPRLRKWTQEQEVFAAYRIDEQLTRALDRKVWLPSGGSIVIDRTEAMVVVDVNTGKFTGRGGNLEETVTKNNLEAAEEIVRQLRLRDLGGIIVIDFIDMVLESNRELVLRRLLECLSRDRTKHQVAEVTSLGLVQMTRKRVGQGLLEAFSQTCEGCNGRGVIVSMEAIQAPAEPKAERGRRRRGGRGGTPAPEPAERTAEAEEVAEAAGETLPPEGMSEESTEESTEEAVAEAAEAAAETVAPTLEPVDAEPVDAEPVGQEGPETEVTPPEQPNPPSHRRSRRSRATADSASTS